MDSERFIVCREFNITLISARDLENVRQFFKMKVYCTVSFGNESRTEKRTPIDRDGMTNPAWNHQMGYTIAESGILKPGLMLVIKLYCKRKLGDRYIGQVDTSVDELFKYADQPGRSATKTLPLQKGSAKTTGELKFSYSFGETITIEKPPLWKKVVLNGAWILMQAATLATIGLTVPINIPVSKPEIVEGEASRRS